MAGEDAHITPARAAVIDRVGRWATEQVGRLGHWVAEAGHDVPELTGSSGAG
jgi:hypothetical protein